MVRLSVEQRVNIQSIITDSSKQLQPGSRAGRQRGKREDYPSDQRSFVLLFFLH